MINENRSGYKSTPLGWMPEEWSIKEFGRFAYVSKKKYTPVSNEDKNCIELEHINQEFGTINGFINSSEQKSTKNVFEKGQVLFGKLRPYLKKYWQAEFDGVCSSEVWVLQANLEDCCNEYLFRLIQQHRFIQVANVSSGSKMPRADWDFVAEYPFALPTFFERKKIATILSIWDEAITKTQQLIAQLQQSNKGLMQQLLTGKKRLPGFEGEWKEIHMKDAFTERNETGYLNHDLLSVGSLGIYPQSHSDKRDISNTDKSKYKRICPNDIGYNTMRMWQGRSALSSLEGIVSPAYTIVTPKENENGLFYSFLFKLPSVVHKFFRNSQGLVEDTLNCKFGDFAKIKVEVPEYNEQLAIADLLSKSTDEVLLHGQKLAALQQQKKGLMQKLLTGEIRVKI